MTMVLHASKAQGVGGVPVTDTQILIKREIVTEGVSLADQRERAVTEGVNLETALFESLPGSIYDQLFAAMARRKVSLMAVSLNG